MGCPICLDEFDQTDGDPRRATALTCGHIFHHDCLQTWFFGESAAATNRVNQKRCPFCAVPTNPAAMVKLFPSDGDDLSVYLSGQKLHEMVIIGRDGGATAPDNSDPFDYKKLLSDLMDFIKAVQDYVMATHSMHSENALKSGVKVRKFVKDLANDYSRDKETSFTMAIDALESASGEFSAMKNDAARAARKMKKLQADVEKDQHRAEQMVRSAQEMTDRAMATMREAQHKMIEVDQRWAIADTRHKANAQRYTELQEKESSLKAREQELGVQEKRMTLDCSMKIGSMRQTTDAEITLMRNKMDDALKRAELAERERKAAHEKSLTLADQMKQLSDRKKLNPPGAGPSRISDSSAAKDRRIRALEKQVEARDSQLKELGFVASQHRLNRPRTSLTNQSFVDLTRSSSPTSTDGGDHSPVTPRDGQAVTSQASSSAATRAVSPTPQRKGKKRARTSLSVEREGLDDEMDDAYPMPGFGVVKRPTIGAPEDSILNPHRPRQPSEGASSTASAGFSTTLLAKRKDGPSKAATTRKNTPRKASPKPKGRASDPSTGNTAKPNYNWLANKNGVQLGPKHRPKEG